MGLVGAELFCYLNDYELVSMTPNQFLRRPHIWLDAIGRFDATLAVTPNFGLQYCSRFLGNEPTDAFKLGSLKALFCGAEPVRRRMLTRFAEILAPSGFREEMYFPCYGMAETTLASTIRHHNEPVSFTSVDQSALNLKLGSEVVRCSGVPDDVEYASVGPAVEGAKMAIVDDEGLDLGSVAGWVSGLDPLLQLRKINGLGYTNFDEVSDSGRGSSR